MLYWLIFSGGVLAGYILACFFIAAGTEEQMREAWHRGFDYAMRKRNEQ